MLRNGKSFSGRERHCGFLNLGEGTTRFANVSAVAGLDLIDDGRGLAYTDWDHDGDLDLWMTSRTGPRVHFLKNNFPATNQWVGVRLRGTTSNRDAIGARVMVQLANGSNRVRSLAAGHGHLSQSTKILHFGLGEEGEVEAVTVHWPGGKEESFEGASAGGLFLLEQGTGKGRLIERPGTSLVSDSEFEGWPASSSRCIVLLQPGLVPQLLANDLSGQPLDLMKDGQPVLLNLWATWCPDCRNEMEEWKAAAAKFTKAGLRVISVAVDDEEDLVGKIRARVLELAYPFEVALPGEDFADTLDTLQRAYTGTQSDLPVPSCLLIDGQGRLQVIYRGSVTSGVVLDDLSLLKASFDERLEKAVPFGGHWIERPQPGDTSKIAAGFAAKGQLERPAGYVEFVFARNAARPGLISRGEAAALHRIRGAVLLDLKRYEAALESWLALAELAPEDQSVHLEVARCSLALERLDEAIKAQERALEISRTDPAVIFDLATMKARKRDHAGAVALFREALVVTETPAAHFQLAGSLVALGETGEAVVALKAALKMNPRWPLAANNLAWILATAPKDELRNGQEALRLAKVACEESQNQYPSALSTLAAAYAEIGEFQQAGEAMGRAMKLKIPERTRKKYEVYQSSYREGKAWRDAALK